MKITKRGQETRQRMMAYIMLYFDHHGYAPSYREIADGIGMKSTSSIYHHLKILFDEGKIETDVSDFFHNSRAFRIGGQA